MRAGAYTNFRVGRILWEGSQKKIGELNRPDLENGEDILLPKDQDHSDWAKSDHCPIYFDTDSKKHALPFGGEKASGKPKQEEELFELDPNGKPRKLLKKSKEDKGNEGDNGKEEIKDN